MNDQQKARIVKSPIELKKRVKIIEDGDSQEAIAAAHAALMKVEPEFTDWLDALVKELKGQSGSIDRNDKTPIMSTDLYRAAFDIHGQAATIGFDSIGSIASMLCEYLEKQTYITADALAVTYQCVETIGAMEREDVRDIKHPISTALIDALNAFMIKKPGDAALA